MPSAPLVSIGITSFNRPEGLLDTIRCMRGQTYENLQIIASDNHSEIDPQTLFPAAVLADDRIRYTRQRENTGSIRNFEFVLEQATGDYFMWASDDDLWAPEFVEAGVDFLESHPDFDAWFPTVDSIDAKGELVRSYASFERFTSSGSRARDVWEYLVEPEIMGKANLVYALYRMDVIRELVKNHMMQPYWGSDMCFNLALISRYRLKCDSRVLLHKRLPEGFSYGEDLVGTSIRDPGRHIFPLEEAWAYFSGLFRAAGGPVMKSLVVLSFMLRLPVAVMNHLRR